MYLHAKDPHEGKYHLFINKRQNTYLKHLTDSKALDDI